MELLELLAISKSNEEVIQKKENKNIEEKEK
jgi:hypothetical protein